MFLFSRLELTEISSFIYVLLRECNSRYKLKYNKKKINLREQKTIVETRQSTTSMIRIDHVLNFFFFRSSSQTISSKTHDYRSPTYVKINAV